MYAENSIPVPRQKERNLDRLGTNRRYSGPNKHRALGFTENVVWGINKFEHVMESFDAILKILTRNKIYLLNMEVYLMVLENIKINKQRFILAKM